MWQTHPCGTLCWLNEKVAIIFKCHLTRDWKMCAHTHSHIHRASLITGLTVCAWSLNSVAPKRENPSNLALLGALRLQQGKEVEGTGSESHFERRSLHHNLTVTMLCLHGSPFCRLSFAKILECVSVLVEGERFLHFKQLADAFIQSNLRCMKR